MKNWAGPAEIWTRIAGFRVQSANHYTTGPLALHGEYSLTWLKQKHGIMKLVKNCWPAAMIETSQPLPWPGFEPGLSRPQREVLTTIRSRPFRQLTTGTAKCGHIRHHTYLDFTTFVFITQEQKSKLWSGHKLKSFECIRCVMCNSLYL